MRRVRIRQILGIALSVAITIGIADVAKAADAASWSGIYAGVSIGARAADATWDTKALASDAAGSLGLEPSTDNVESYDSAALRLGGFAGYNWQFARSWVTGLEGDFGWGHGREAHDGIPGTGITAFGITDERFRVDRTTVEHEFDGSARARIGYLVSDAVLLYVTTGVAWQSIEVRVQCGGTLEAWCLVGNVRDESTSSLRTGWTAGAGIETRIAGNWLARLEYRYADFGSFEHTFFEDTIDAVKAHVDLRTHTVSAGVAYRFWGR